jgi:hypothetical protein
MGVVPNISHDKFPQQGKFLNQRVQVCFNYDTSNLIGGAIVRDDTEEPGREIIKLDDGRYVLSTECQYSIDRGVTESTTPGADPTREELIALCLRATPQQSVWSDRDSSAAVRQMGQAWALLSCGCEFTILRDPSGLNSDASTWWIEITFHGFSVFDGMCSDDDIADFVETKSFYIPTAARIDARPDRHWY